MKEYLAEQIKNIIILGHLGSGKTSLAEALAFVSGTIEKKGEVEKKNTLSDFTVEEQTRQNSLSTSVIRFSSRMPNSTFSTLPALMK